MRIDPIILIAQIVNFVVLLWLLWKLLFKPITAAMDEREARLAEQMRSAEKHAASATQQAAELTRMQAELAAHRDALIADAQADAQRIRAQLLDAARHEIDDLRGRWIQTLNEQRRGMLLEIRQSAGDVICNAVRNALRDLANEPLERAIATQFSVRLNRLEEKHRVVLDQAIDDAQGRATVRSAFDLNSDVRGDLSATLRRVFRSTQTIEFEKSADVLCGVELRVPGRKLAWSFAEFLDELEQEITGLPLEPAAEDTIVEAAS